MIHKLSALTLPLLLFIASCNSQETTDKEVETSTENLGPVVDKKSEPHKYGGWYCPDNFGFTPVDVQKLDEVPAIADRLPTEEELQNNMSLINVDIEKYPDAKALEMDLPKVAKVYSEATGMDELIIVIQAIVVQEDTVLGWRFMNGGNGSGWLTDVTFLSEDEVADMGSQPFFYSNTTLNSNTEKIWKALTATDYFTSLGKKFDQLEFFTTPFNPDSQAHLEYTADGEKGAGFCGMHFGNYYMHIDYNLDGFHYSEKMLIMENQEEKTTEFFFASGPYPEGFETEKAEWENFVSAVKKASEEG